MNEFEWIIKPIVVSFLLGICLGILIGVTSN